MSINKTISLPDHLADVELPNLSKVCRYAIEDAVEVRRRAIDGAHTERTAVVEEGLAERTGVLVDRRPGFVRGLDHLVVDVGQVHDEPDVVPAPLEVAMDEVEEEEGPEVPDVGVAVDRGAAVVEAGLARLDRVEGHLLAAQGVVEVEAHGAG